MALLSISNLNVNFTMRGKCLHAVSDLTLDIDSKEIVGIVGESGSGKSVTCMSILKLLSSPPATIKGQIFFKDQNILQMSSSQIRQIRGNRISMIFQDPLSAFNPYLKISEQLIEPLMYHQRISSVQARKTLVELLESLGISDAEKKINLYPHQFSGGMLQRAMIAMALSTSPDLLIADEPTTALDVTTQAQIIKLFKEIRDKYHVSIIFVTHNLGIVNGLCDRVAVMYAGRIVEIASADQILKSQSHPYTKALFDSVPRLETLKKDIAGIPGAPPDLTKKILGCPFIPRCSFAFDNCKYASTELGMVNHNQRSSCLRVLQKEIIL